MTTQMTVAKWLEKCGCENIQPVRVTIRGTTYNGARYADPKQPHVKDAFYLIGEQPKRRVKRPNKTCFQFNGADWYVAGYWDGHGADSVVFDASGNLVDYDQYHPFGRNFILMPWSVPSGEPIDYYEQKPYDRFPMTVEEV